MTHRYRSARTGQFVTETYALRHPKTTVSERVNRKPRRRAQRLASSRANRHRP